MAFPTKSLMTAGILICQQECEKSCFWDLLWLTITETCIIVKWKENSMWCFTNETLQICIQLPLLWQPLIKMQSTQMSSEVTSFINRVVPPPVKAPFTVITTIMFPPTLCIERLQFLQILLWKTNISSSLRSDDESVCEQLFSSLGTDFQSNRGPDSDNNLLWKLISRLSSWCSFLHECFTPNLWSPSDCSWISADIDT